MDASQINAGTSTEAGTVLTNLTKDRPASLRPLLEAVFAAWMQAGIPFLVLRNYDQLPDFTGNDVDVLIPPDCLKAAETSLRIAARHVGYLLHHRAQFDPLSLFVSHPSTGQQVQIDLFTRLAWRGIPLLDSSLVLARRRLRNGIAVPDPVDEAVLNLFIRLLYQGSVREKYRAGIQEVAQFHRVAWQQRLGEIVGHQAAIQLANWASAGNWSAIEQRKWHWRWRVLRRALARQPGKVLANLLYDARRLWSRWWRPPGLLVVLLGPDGSGKTTVARQLIQAMRPTFQPAKSRLGHWKPALLQLPHRKRRPPATNPHQGQPRGRFLSVALYLIHWLEYMAGFWLVVQPVRFRNGMMVMDRYYYDFQVDPRRYRLAPPPRWIVKLYDSLPRPNLIFVLEAPLPVLRQRKTEVSEEETLRQQAGYRSLANRLPGAYLIDSARPLPQVVEILTSQILACLAERANAGSP
ncbi:MAG: hypothetical protein RMN51_02030 [Verrucomicrobiota bacterium]|nr:hypothetical protein [Limisphaera sp.]MDW8380877.1 hypothetical protein [Verrucomicrobiota bacterium]